MVYTGGVQFKKISSGSGVWIEDLRLDDERKTALIAHVGTFRNCTTKPDGRRHAILGHGGVESGWIHYDVEEIVDLRNVRCVVIGKCGKVWQSTKYMILVVRPTGVDGAYGRVGSGMIRSDYVVGDAFNMRIV